MINSLVKKYLEFRLKEVDHFIKHPFEIQQKVLSRIINNNYNTKYFQKYKIHKNSTYSDFSNKFPSVKYEDAFPLINDMIEGNHEILCSNKIKLFAKSSGTTTGVSKYIPLSKSYLFSNHIKASWFAAGLVYRHNPKAKIFKHKNLLMGGTVKPMTQNPKMLSGDISGFTISNIPAAGRPFYTPDFKTALIEDWDLKINRMSDICGKEKVFLFAGVPTWTIVLFEKLLEKYKVNNIVELWPEVNVYMHGGVNFAPYKNQFEAYLPKDDFHYMEIYNASEGCFAIQYEKHEKDMLLLLDNDIYYEFSAVAEREFSDKNIIPLEEVKTGISYELIISNTSGLYRYRIGDVIEFTSTDPYLLKIIGRTKEYINAFGEELMINNTELALEKTCQLFNASISNYSVAPVYLSSNQKGYHQWLVEFKKPPENLLAFAQLLDQQLKNCNSDYAAKRHKDLALKNLEIICLPIGTFENWLRSKGKFGNQNKVPRLRNDRVLADEILSILT